MRITIDSNFTEIIINAKQTKIINDLLNAKML